MKLPYSIDSILYGTEEGRIRIRVPGTADFVINCGEVLVAPEEGVSEVILASLLTALVLGFLIHQKPILTLHGSAVVGNGAAIVLLGKRGSGKSTTAAAFCRRGFRMLCDDIVPISADGSVLPGMPRARLARDAYARLIGDPDSASHLWDCVDKYQVILPISSIAAQPRGAFLLVPWEKAELAVERVKGWKKIQELTPHVQTLDGIDDKNEVFRRMAEWVTKVPLIRVLRPIEGYRIDELLDLIESHCRKETS
jgi:hypothetical protein